MTKTTHKSKLMQPPAYLRKDGRKLWQVVLTEFDLPKDALPLLELACQSWDRYHDARRSLDKNGTIYTDRFQQVKARPETLVERDSKLAVAKFLKQLGLDIEPAAMNQRK